MTPKTCERCGKPLTGRQTRWCSYLCNVKNWRAGHLEQHREIQRTNYRNHHERSVARFQVKLALIAGTLVKPKTCSACGEQSKYIDAHHRNGYAEEHWLDVAWLCRACHGKAHRQPRKPHAPRKTDPNWLDKVPVMRGSAEAEALITRLESKP